MADLDIITRLSEAKNRKWDDRTLAQKAADFAQDLLTYSLKQLHGDERTLLSALSRLVAEEKNRDFLTRLCRRVLLVSDEQEQVDNLRTLMNDFGGVPTFFGTMGRLRFKAASLAAGSMRSAALAEVHRVFHSTFSGLTLPTHEEKRQRALKDFAKDKITCVVDSLSPVVFGRKSCDRYRRNLQLILGERGGAGIVISPTRLCPSLRAVAPMAGARELAEELRALMAVAAKNATPPPVVISADSSAILPIVAEAFKMVISGTEFRGVTVAMELPAYLSGSEAMLRELTTWADARAGKGVPPVNILLTKGSSLDQERENSFIYGGANPVAASKSETEIRYKQLVHQAVHASPKSLSPIIGTHNYFDIAYALLDWGRSGRSGLPGFMFLAGLGNHVGRMLAHSGAPVCLMAGVTSEDPGAPAFESHLLALISELSRPDGYLSAGYSVEPNSMGWGNQRKNFLAALSGREITTEAPPKSADSFIPTDLEHMLNRASLEAYYAAAEAEAGRQRKMLPLRVGAQKVDTPITGVHRQLTSPNRIDYRYMLADFAVVEEVVSRAREASAGAPADPAARRVQLLRVARALREKRDEFVGLLMRDGGFCMEDALLELRTAEDACLFYEYSSRRNGLYDGSTATPLGVVVISPDRSHPLADAVASIAAAWVTGNTIIYKPDSYTVLLGSLLTKLLSGAGIKDPDFQFVPVLENQMCDKLLCHEHVQAVIMHGNARAAHDLCRKSPECHVLTHGNGGTSVYLAAGCDWPLAVRMLAAQGFLRSGQSPLAPHVIFAHESIYDNQHFVNALKDAVSSLTSGSGLCQESDLGLLSRPLTSAAEKFLTSIPQHESWLVTPTRPDPDSLSCTPGIRTGVTLEEAPRRARIPLPVFNLVRVHDVAEAIDEQRQTSTGQAAAIFCSDEKEIEIWQREVNCAVLCVNCLPEYRPGQVPFGTTHPVSLSTTCLQGGPNYLLSLSSWEESGLPQVRGRQRNISFSPQDVLSPKPTPDESMRLTSAADSISYWWENEFGMAHTLCSRPGQETVLRYLPVPVCIRVEKATSDIDLSIALMAALRAGCEVQVSTVILRPWMPLCLDQLGVPVRVESRADFESRFAAFAADGVRVRDCAATETTLGLAAAADLCICRDSVLGNGRIELLHYLREQVITRRTLLSPQ